MPTAGLQLAPPVGLGDVLSKELVDLKPLQEMVDDGQCPDLVRSQSESSSLNGHAQ